MFDIFTDSHVFPTSDLHSILNYVMHNELRFRKTRSQNYVEQQSDSYCSTSSFVQITRENGRWLGGLLVERRTSVSQILGSTPGQVVTV